MSSRGSKAYLAESPIDAVSTNSPLRAEETSATITTNTKKIFVREEFPAVRGATEPLGLWDPADVASNFEGDPELQSSVYLSLEEAERKHGRVCMLAALGIFIGETGFGVFLDGGTITGTATSQWNQMSQFWPMAPYFIIWICAMAEVEAISRFWKPGFEAPTIFNNLGGLKSDFVPGDYGFDPLKIKPKTEAALLKMTNKEINNGRLAMLAVAGILAQESVTGVPVF